MQIYGLMDNFFPDKKILTDYFFNRCDAQTAGKIEQWFMDHGKSAGATALLYELWHDVRKPENIADKTETDAAFDRFRSELLRKTSSTVTGDSVRTQARKADRRLGFAAAIAVLLLSATVFQSIRVYRSENVNWQEKSVASGETGFVTLPDGTSVWMNAGSRIVYPQKFVSGKRQVFFSGEAHFNVAKDKRKEFEIQTGDAVVTVLGTEFNLKSYNDENELELALLEGKVRFETSESRQLTLLPGEAVEFDRNSNEIHKYSFDKDDYSSWKDGNLYFKNCPLSRIVRQLERKFDVEIVIATDSLKTVPYHMAFVNDESLDEILSVLGSGTGIHVEKKESVIEIY